MLSVEVKLLSNPWEHSVPDTLLYDLLSQVGESRAKHVEKQHDGGNGEWPRDSLGLALMIPHAPRAWMPEDAILGTIAIGEEGERFVTNAIGKAFYHHSHGEPAGYGVYVDLAASMDGDFCYGFSAEVDGMIAAASGQKETQDACEAAHAAATFLYYIRRERGGWMEKQTERPHWFCDEDLPDSNFTHVASRRSIFSPA